MGKRRLAFKLACHKTVSDLAGSYPRALFSALLAIGGSYGAYFVALKLGREWPGDELIPAYVGFAFLVAVWIAWFLYNWLFHVPYQQWACVEGRVAELERELRPRFSVPHLIGGRPKSLEYGETVTTLGGQKITNVTETNELLCFPVTNITASTLRGCEAYLSRFERSYGEPWFWQSRRLHWLDMDKEHAAVDIPPHGLRSVVLFKVMGNRVHFLSDSALVMMSHYIEAKGQYHGLVTLTADGAPSTLVAFTLSCDGPDQVPTINIMRKNIGEDDDATPWAVEEPF